MTLSVLGLKVEADVVDGKGFLHDLEGDGTNGAAMSELWAKVKDFYKAQAVNEIYGHFAVDDAERLGDVYEKRWGFVPVATIMKVEI